MDIIDISHTEEIYTVTRLNREIRFLLEGTYPLLWVEGEISNFVVPQSGHWYFSLKDTGAQIKCAMFKPQNRRLSFTPKDGAHVVLKARASLYEGRGDFQLLIEHMEEAGTGKLQKEFEALKQKLSAAGLFDAKYKKELPALPTVIGVVTSPTGAAIRDILSVLKRRYPSATVIVYPTLVQGELAADQIVAAINTANRRNECDVLIVARGGGSIEDLWPFNEEKVAHAIHRSVLPIISGVGHEIDFTIADFVADVRAPTPSAAAELISPDTDELISSLHASKKQLSRCIQQQLQHAMQQLAWMQKHLLQQHPKRRLAEQEQRLDHSEIALVKLQTTKLSTLNAKIDMLREKLLANTPKHFIRDNNQQLTIYKNRLMTAIHQILQLQKQHMGNLAAKLDALSPLATLQRGFAIATKDKTILRSANQVTKGDQIEVVLAEGKIGCRVD